MIVGNFKVNGIDYVVVRLENSAHIMPKADWRKICKLYSKK